MFFRNFLLKTLYTSSKRNASLLRPSLVQKFPLTRLQRPHPLCTSIYMYIFPTCSSTSSNKRLMHPPQSSSSLAGGYYGTPIPPQPRRSPFLCLFSTLAKCVIAFCVALGLATLVLWLVYRPHKIKVVVQDAILTDFSLATDRDILHFDLDTNITIRNPNEKIGIYYDWLESDAYYDGFRFGWVPMAAFYQGRKNTTVLRPAFRGQSLFSNRDSGDFRRENSTGLFNINVWLYSRVRYKFGSLVTRRYMARVRCVLALRLARNETSTNNQFTTTRCDVVDF